MTVSKAFWKITAKNIGTLITYTIILVLFGAVFRSSDSTVVDFEARKPAIVIFNHDEEFGVTKSFISYLDKNTTVETGYEDDDRLKDALFYEQVILAIDIPEGFHQDMTFGRNPELKMRSSSGYSAELAKTIVKRYLTTVNAYASSNLSELDLVSRTEKALESETVVEVSSKVDTGKYYKASSYFNFANYSILACVITVICLIMSSFNRRAIRQRNLVSAVEIKKMNAELLRNCCIYSAGVWLLYMVIGVALNGSEVMFSLHGLLFAINALVFSAFATTIAFLLSNLVSSQGAINGIMNVIGLGSSFLCGAFVPAEYLPDSVLAFAHILPSYYYIDANNKITNLADTSFGSILPVILNIAIVAASAVAMVVITNIIAKKRQKIA